MSFVLLCALPPEAVAARLGLRRSGGIRIDPGRVKLVGMGPLRARKAASRLASVLPDGVPVVVLGVGGALVAGTEPGDLIVANALGAADAAGAAPLEITEPPAVLDARSAAFSDQVAAALSDRFGSTRQAPVLSAGRTAKGPERLALAASGAVICDTESYWLARLADRRPFAVVRAIVDTPDRELVSMQTVTGGIRGLRRLSDAAEVIADLLAGEPASRTA
jgi:4-hydroxy-3-methylbut-2-enyl diphosphate reductase